MNLFEEFTYLSTKNKYRYNGIMELFLNESERINLELTEDYIYQKLQDDPYTEDKDYTKEQLTRDLQYLVENHNISIQQESLQNIHTLEEYKNRKRYYSITKKGAFVARNIRQYLLVSNKSVLCDEHFKRVIHDIRECKHKGSISSWNMLFEDCRNVFQVYQDFLAEFNSSKFDEISSTFEFKSYKNDFLEQIHLLIDKLSKYAKLISKELENLNTDDPRLNSVKKWFLYIDDEEPTYITILHYCSMLIEKITRKAKLFVSVGEESADFKKALRRFKECESFEECEILSVSVVGIQKMPHLNYHGPFSVNETEKKEKPETEPDVFDETAKMEDEKQALLYLKQEMEREEYILSMKIGNEISFNNLTDLDTKETLTVLDWLGRAMEDSNRCSETSNGKSFSIDTSDRRSRIEFHTKYGVLEMPDIRLIFKGEENE